MTTRWTKTADVVVVGLGVTGGPVIEELIGHGARRRICVVERGCMWDPDQPFQPGRSARGESDVIDLQFHDSSHAPRPLSSWWTTRAAGGGALLWYGQMSRFAASDLRMRGLFGDSAGSTEIRDWPLEYAELCTLYDEIQRRLATVGSSYGHSSADYARFDGGVHVDRGTPSHFERHVIDRLRAAGLYPYVGQTCTGGRAWDLHPVSPVTGERRDPGTPMRSRPNWYVQLYRRLVTDERVTVLDRTRAVRVIADKGKVVGVECVRLDRENPGRMISIKARVVVLACGPLETVRVLLSSDLPNRNQLIGKRLTFTTERTGYLLTTEPRSRDMKDRLAGLYSTVVLKDFYEVSGHPLLRKGGKFALYDALVAEAPQRHVRNLRLFGPGLARFLRAERDQYVVKVSFKGESLPWQEKFASLKGVADRDGVRKLRVSYRPHPLDMHLQEQVAKWFHTIADGLGANDRLLHSAPTGTALVSAHHHGGATFGADPTDAVLTPNCECYEARGLFVADASFMPTSGATNASLTAMANALRVGREVSRRV